MSIVFIDPSSAVREPLSALLRQRGHEVAAVGSYAEALGVLSCMEPKAIVVDPFVEGVDTGSVVLQRVRGVASAQEAPLVILTDCATRPAVVCAARAGARAYLLKSQFSLSGFVQRLENLIKGGDASGGDAGSERAPAAALPEDPMAALRELKPAMGRSEVETALADIGDMKALSPCVAQVMSLTRQESASIDAIAKAIKRDQAIALKILKLANSSVYNRGDPVDSIKNAIVRIGVGQIRQAVMNISVMDRFSSGEGEGIDPGRFWEHAIAVGLAAAQLSADYQEFDADAAFTMGLMHDIGKMLLQERMPDTYSAALRTARETGLPLEWIEKRLMLVSHADLMDRTLRSWGFPRHLINPIALHHLSASNIRRHAPQEVEATCVLAVADRLAHAMMIGASGNETIYPIDDLCEAAKIKPAMIDRVAKSVREETHDMKFSLLSLGDMGTWTDQLEATRGQLRESFRPLFVSANPEMDAIRIFVEQLADGFTEEDPNCAVVHIRGGRYREEVVRKLLAAEEAAGLRDLPLVLILPSANLKIDRALLERRPARLLTAPFAVSRFVGAVNELIAPSEGEATGAKAA